MSDLGTEKYGRVLAKLHRNGVCLNDWLVKEGLAVPYDGGTKGVPPLEPLGTPLEKLLAGTAVVVKSGKYATKTGVVTRLTEKRAFVLLDGDDEARALALNNLTLLQTPKV